MDKKDARELGRVTIKDEVIAEAAKEAALLSYGVKAVVPPGSSLGLFPADEKKPPVRVRKNAQGYEVDIYVVLAYGLKMTEVISSVQKQVSFSLRRKLPIHLSKVNVFVEDVKEVH